MCEVTSVLSQKNPLDRDDGNDDASQENPVATLDLPGGEILNLERLSVFACVGAHMTKRGFRCFPLCNHELQVSAGADPPKCMNATRKHAEYDAFHPGKLSIVFNFSAPSPPSKHLSTYLLLHKWVFPQFFKCQPSLAPPEPNFDLQALQSSRSDKSSFRDVHTCSCLKIPNLFISYLISRISPSLTASFRAGTAHTSAHRAQLNQCYDDFMIVMPAHCCHFSLYSQEQLFSKRKRNGYGMLAPSPFHTEHVHIVTRGLKFGC